MIRDPYQFELQAIAKQTVVNVRRREKEKLLEATDSKPLDSVRGSEIKVNINPAVAALSAVKPMRLSFKHI